MKNSHLYDYFITTAWFLDLSVYNRLYDILTHHLMGTKDAERLIGAYNDNYDENPKTEESVDSIINDIAIINIRGVLAPHSDQVNAQSQPQGRSYDNIQRQLVQADANPQVNHIVLKIESPGGSASGAQETFDFIRGINKPVHAFVNNYAYSAAYYLASAADDITLSSTSAGVGSIGAIMSIPTKNAGERIIVRSAPLKALPSDGEVITDLAISELQRVVNAYGDEFKNAVSSTRDVSDEVYSGQVFLGRQAIDLGLADNIMSWSKILQP